MSFIADLKAENEAILAKLNAPPGPADADLKTLSLPVCELLERLASTPEAQQLARHAARGLLETGERVRAAAMAQRGASVIPGC